MKIQTTVTSNGVRIVANEIQDRIICSSRFYKDPKSILIISNNKRLKNYSRMLKKSTKDFIFKDIFNILYSINPKEECDPNLYLSFLLNLVDTYPSKEFNFTDMTKYNPGEFLEDSDVCLCSHQMNMAPVVLESFDDICETMDELELPIQCKTCPIRSGCIKCKNGNLDYICQMHQAEAIACIYHHYINETYPTYRGHIPYLWTLNFGEDIANNINNIRNTSSLRWMTNLDDVYLNLYITSKKDIGRIKGYLDDRMIPYSDIELNTISAIIIPSEELYLNKYMIDNHIYDVEYSYTKRTSEDIYTSNMKYYKSKRGVVKVDKIYFGLEEYCNDSDIIPNIIDSPQYQQGINNPYTRAMICVMQKYSFHEKNILDIGCGKGLLSIVAKHLGASRVIGIDNDPVAGENYKNLVKCNGYDLYKYKDGFEFHQLAAISYISRYCAKFDIILCNMVYPIIKNEVIKYISSIMNDDSILIISGFNLIIEKSVVDMIHNSNLEVHKPYYFNDIEVIVIKKRG